METLKEANLQKAAPSRSLSHSDPDSDPLTKPLEPSSTNSIETSLTCTTDLINELSKEESGYSESQDTSSSDKSDKSDKSSSGSDQLHVITNLEVLNHQDHDRDHEHQLKSASLHLENPITSLTTISSENDSDNFSDTNFPILADKIGIDKDVQVSIGTALPGTLKSAEIQTESLVGEEEKGKNRGTVADKTSQTTASGSMAAKETSKRATLKRVTFLDQLKGFTFLATLTVTAFCGSMFLMGLVTPLAYIPQTVKYHRRLVDRVIGLWFLFAISIMELILKLKFRVTGDPIVRGENCLYFMNHRTRFDWMWIWPLLYHYARLRKLKIVLKSPLKWVPGFGWACQQAVFMFLKRHWNQDRQNMKDTLEYFNFVNNPVELLVFPEGTDFRPETLASSERFAIKNNLPKYNYVLHPRTTGFEFLIDEMRKKNQVSYVCDLTVGYPINMLQDEVELCKTGAFPREIHFHVEKFRIDELPNKFKMLGSEGESLETKLEESSEGGDGQVTVGDWLNERFRLKEQKLSDFYNHPDPTKRVFSEKESTETYQPRTLGMVLCLIFWPLATSLWISLIFSNYYFRCFQMLITLFYVLNLVVHDGFERWLCKRNRVRERKGEKDEEIKKEK